MSEDDTTTSAPTADTGDAGSTTVDTQPTATPAMTGDATQTTPGTETPDALTTGEQVQADPQAPTDPASQSAPQAVNWEKRYRDQQSFHDRRFAQQQQEFQKLQQEFYETRRRQAEEQKQASLKPWSSQHPEHKQFSSTLEKAKAIHKQLEAARQLPPEQQQAAQQAIMAGISPQEQEALQSYREDMANFQASFFANPQEALAPVVKQIAAQIFEQQQQEAQGRMQVQQDFQQPHIQQLLENPVYSDYLRERLEKGAPYDIAMENLKLKAATDIMYQRLSGSQRSQATAQAQSALAKGRAAQTIQPNPAAAPVDPYALAAKEAKAKGILPGTAQFNRLLDKYTAASG